MINLTEKISEIACFNTSGSQFVLCGLWRWILLNPISPEASLAKQRNNPILVLFVKNKNYHWSNEVIRQRNEF